ncbi:MAG TPA: hypothetical protein VM573_09750 [Actinomycetota bacterium]|jgi:hypothetical protein|nr:hypothetical protein [Actinomycetota bacterium]
MSDERIEKLAAKLLRENGFESMDQARAAARAMLEESDERTADPAAHDHEHEEKIRRTSGETASTGESGVSRRVFDGD